QLAVRLRGSVHVAEPPATLHDAATSFATARLVVSARFHALLAAAAAGTPLLAVANEHKQAAVATRLGQPWVRAHAAPERMRAVVQAALGGEPPARAAIRGEIAAA